MPYTDTLGTLKGLRKLKETIADRDERLEVRIAKEVLRQTRRGWGIEDIATAIGRTTGQTQRILREAKQTYGEGYVSGVISADKKGQGKPAVKAAAPKAADKKEKPKAAAKKTDEPRKASKKKKDAAPAPLPKKSGGAKRKRKNVTAPVQATDETHYEDPSFDPDGDVSDNFEGEASGEPAEIAEMRAEDAELA